MNIRVNLTSPRRELAGDDRLRTQTSIDHDDWTCDNFIVREADAALVVQRGDTNVAIYPAHAWTRLVQTEDDFETVIAP